MLDPKLNKLRPLLTETLPYEVPVNYSNEFLYVSEARKNEISDQVRQFIDSKYRKRLKEGEYTIPFTYPVRRGDRSPNKISIVHPLQQLHISDFMHEYAETILQECSESPNSLRAPYEVLSPIAKSELKKLGDVKKIGVPHVAPRDGKLDLSFAASYFSVRKYNLLDKFYNSNELVRLESRFSMMRSIDVTKCFFNIYTHSITWAVKDKRYSKNHANKYTFEGRFDTLMQRSNYNETNGIVVGPEVSRIFAEIIFQKIDINIRDSLAADGLVSERDYAIRRYVDDFFIFSSDLKTMDTVFDCVQRSLEAYKLYLNEGKSRFSTRPFVTNITRAKQGVSKLSDEIVELSSKALCEEPDKQREIYLKFRQVLEDLRLIVSDNKASFSEATGSTYFKLSKAVRCLRSISKTVTEETEVDLVNRIRGLVRILFYIVASDFRVAPIYRSYQIIEELLRLNENLRKSTSEAMMDRLNYEVCELIKSNLPEEKNLNNGVISLELCNLLLLGSLVGTKRFNQQPVVEEIAEKALRSSSLGYFSFVALMYIFGQSDGLNTQRVAQVSEKVFTDITARATDVRTEAELYLLVSDYLSCPYVTRDRKRDVLDAIYGERSFSNEAIDILALHVAFVDWSGGRTSHFLRRKRLQPVYNLVA
ncbi:antiviral reverse transcriptase Drt3b [Paracoccus saliphilus]|uniref:RNA-directed DNA polymerase n=1 Tax=Paracoccus saliphilus TaxID=405559 RepID=A0AA45W7D1_9RHOB|nr:antiviral reverse transcriptase Drt3b [Paracoccus saliphilus]WCR02753.1 RNA-directed DNA polymerase [Paracoccus saliphilus]SIT08786.1 Reverse transcriptase (RNA-dependent DNA polymerase) [Paracoccus saliphilus]